MSIWKMSSSANQPVWVGSSAREQLAADVEEAEARRAEQVLDRAAGDEVDPERVRVEVDRADRLVRVGEAERAGRVGDLGDRGDVVPVAGAVRDGRAADKGRPLVDCLGEALGRDRAVGLGRTWTTSAPRSSCACAIWPTVGNSYSLITIFGRACRSSVETIPLTPCVTEVVTASSVASACNSRANAARAASARSTQWCHSAPFSSQPSSQPSTASLTRCESAPCEHEFR